jgi:hypothetical protein
MLPDSPSHHSFDSRVSEDVSVTTTHRLRSSLEMVFQETHFPNADAPASARRELRAALHRVCVDARRSGLRAEQLLVLIKEVWAGIPAGISRVTTLHGDERLNYVISTCVDEYYGAEANDEVHEREVSS